MNKVIITGAAGFAGSHYCRLFCEREPSTEVVVIDKMTYAGRIENLLDLITARSAKLVVGDICDLPLLRKHFDGADCVIHFAAESHVDNSIGDSLTFTRTNTLGTHTLLEAARVTGVERVIHVSTDEVYGPITDGSFGEDAPLLPTNPYSASKAAAELIARAYRLTYSSPLIITRANNLFGPHQFPEKIIPRFILRALTERELPMHGDGRYIRSYLFIEDFCEAMHMVVTRGEINQTYNIGADSELRNIEIAHKICERLDYPIGRISYVSDRPFNDARYRVDDSRIRNLGWEPRVGFDDALDRTIAWYDQNRSWWAPLEF